MKSVKNDYSTSLAFLALKWNPTGLSSDTDFHARGFLASMLFFVYSNSTRHKVIFCFWQPMDFLCVEACQTC